MLGRSATRWFKELSVEFLINTVEYESVMVKMKTVGVLGVLLLSVSFAHAATKTTVMSEEKLAQCYKQAQNLPARLNDCLTQELSMVKKEHKDVTERVFLIAKALDKKKGNKSVTDSHMKANQSFENYVDRECNVMKVMNSGDKLDQSNEDLSCEINLYRMRVDMLENRYLSAEKE